MQLHEHELGLNDEHTIVNKHDECYDSMLEW